MQLTRVQIKNFRGIARLDLALDPLTVVIGENNHGKTSLFDLLDRCLGGPGGGETGVWEYRDFRRTADGALQTIRVLLTFDPEGTPTFAAATPPDGDEPARLHVEFRGDPETGAMDHRFLDGRGRALDVPNSDQVLERLRELHPVLLIRLAQPLEPAVLEWTRPEGSIMDEEDEDESPEEAITRVYHRLAVVRGPIPTEELRRAYLAVEALRDQVHGRVRSIHRPLRRVLDRFLEGGNGASGAPVTGGGGHNLGLLLVLGALLEMRARADLDAEATPIIAIEEPEVHLHPMVLSSTWDVIESLHVQTLVTTNSGELLADVPLGVVRRLVRRDGHIEAFQLRPGRLDEESLRRVGYHVSAKRGAILFARCWLLVEGETEFWLLRELARTLAYDLEAEGVRCVEFAQCGVEPLARLANELGIAWHLLSDGDESGLVFAREAAQFLQGRPKGRHITTLDRRNIEAFLWRQGFEDVYRKAAHVGPRGSQEGDKVSPQRAINRAVRRHSKPYLALTVAEECARRGPESVPRLLRSVIEESVALAREAVEDG